MHSNSRILALLDTSSISRGFSSEHGLSSYLIKHPRDALEVIGFGTGEGTQRGMSLCVHAVCVCVLCFTVNHRVFRKLCG